jgi:hypothetical protein
MHLRSLAVVLVVAIAGCVQPPAPLPPAPTGIQQIGVEPPANRTGRDLTLDNPGWLERLLDERRTNVPSVLATELRAELERHRFRIVEPSHASASLRTEIRRWEPYSADYSMVTVDLVASLVEPESGRTIWTAERSGWRVATRDARSVHEASRMASAAIAAALLEGWEPAPSSTASKPLR